MRRNKATSFLVNGLAYYFWGSIVIIGYHRLLGPGVDGSYSSFLSTLECSLVSARFAPHPPNGLFGPLPHVGVGRTVTMLCGPTSSNPPLDCTSIVELHVG